jgi:uncharacterized protein
MHSGSFKANLKKILHLDGNPERIALSFAIGIFISFSPFYFLHTILALGAAYIFRLNVVAIMIGAWMNNPITTPFFYALGYFLGNFLIGGESLISGIPGKELMSFHFWSEILATNFWNIIYQLLIGCTILGALGGAVSYIAVKYAVISFRRRHSHSASAPAPHEK